MWNCNRCGPIDSAWCDTCQVEVDCDHSDTSVTRLKDVIYDSDAGERTVTLYLSTCKTCGEFHDVSRISP